MSGGNNGKKATAAEVQIGKRWRRAAPVALLAVVLLAAACAVVSARAWLTPRSVAAEAEKVKTLGEEVRDDPPPLPADVTLTTLDASGFTPSEIAHEAGRFRIVVQNRSGVANLDLRLGGEGSSRWTERHVLGEVQGWVAEVELAAGTYTITDAHHPEWVCRLTVE